MFEPQLYSKCVFAYELATHLGFSYIIVAMKPLSPSPKPQEERRLFEMKSMCLDLCVAFACFPQYVDYHFKKVSMWRCIVWLELLTIVETNIGRLFRASMRVCINRVCSNRRRNWDEKVRISLEVHIKTTQTFNCQ